MSKKGRFKQAKLFNVCLSAFLPPDVSREVIFSSQAFSDK